MIERKIAHLVRQFWFSLSEEDQNDLRDRVLSKISKMDAAGQAVTFELGNLLIEYGKMINKHDSEAAPKPN